MVWCVGDPPGAASSLHGIARMHPLDHPDAYVVIPPRSARASAVETELIAELLRPVIIPTYGTSRYTTFTRTTVLSAPAEAERSWLALDAPLVVALLLLFPPAGFGVLWTSPRYSRDACWLVSFITVFFLSLAAVGFARSGLELPLLAGGALR